MITSTFKHLSVEIDLRRRIISGNLAPGAQLPTLDALQAEFNTTRPTLVRVMRRLKRDGFVRAAGRNGTFVTARPPHLSRYALVFPSDPANSRFWEAMNAEALRTRRSTEPNLSIFSGIDGHADSEDLRRLIEDIKAHRVAGLILTTWPQGLTGTPVLDAPDMPRVMIASNFSPGIPAVYPDFQSFIDRAMDLLLSRGRRAVATLALGNQGGRHSLPNVGLAPAAVKRGMRCEPHWQQATSWTDTSWAFNTAHLLFHPNQKDRPDSLIVADEHLIEPASAGLAAAGVRPGEIDVISHITYPDRPTTHFPVTFLGFHAKSILDACLRSIDTQRAGKPVSDMTRIPSAFENEPNPSSAPANG